MATARSNKVVKYRKPRQINIGIIIFAIILVYLIISVAIYFSRNKISIYEVTTQGSITKEKYYTGVAIREEHISFANAAGYINYYVKEGEKAAIGDLIYSMDESGRVFSKLSESENSDSLTDADLNSLKSTILGFQYNFSNLDFQSVYDFKTDMSYDLLELINANNMENLSLAINTAGGEDFFQLYYANESGIVAYYTDGLESLTPETISEKTFAMESYSRINTKSTDLLESGNSVYKLVTDDKWSIMFPLDEEDIEKYGNRTRLTIQFTKDDFRVTPNFSIVTNASGTYGKLDFTKYMVRYISDRFLTFEIIDSVETGLKIPVSSVTEKSFYMIPVEYYAVSGTTTGFNIEVYNEVGESSIKMEPATIYFATDTHYYVDPSVFSLGTYVVKLDSNERYQIGPTASLTGVYNVNKGYAIFRQIEIIAENDEYYIIKPNTKYGLSLYDHIVLDGKTVTENQVLYQ